MTTKRIRPVPLTTADQVHAAPSRALAGAGVRRVHISDLVLDCLIGVHRHERDGTQRIRVNLELDVPEPGQPLDDRLSNVLCYEEVISKLRKLVASGHVNLVETLAERMAALCLEEELVAAVRVRVDKLDVFSDAASVGVEIERVK